MTDLKRAAEAVIEWAKESVPIGECHSCMTVKRQDGSILHQPECEFEALRAALNEPEALANRSAPSDTARELAVAQARLDEFFVMKKQRPIDPVYWDEHHERNLREAIAKAREVLGQGSRGGGE